MESRRVGEWEMKIASSCIRVTRNDGHTFISSFLPLFQVILITLQKNSFF
jgi:hypothetical protein